MTRLAFMRFRDEGTGFSVSGMRVQGFLCERAYTKSV